MAQIGWIDFSTADRRKMSQALSLIRPEGQLDELGIGRIRDGLSDLLFPGISTIQTRAKYFFIVPYILRDYLYLSSKEKIKTSAFRYLEDREHEVKNRLRAKYAGQSNTGIIGITLKDSQRIVRQPSEIYWVGIQTFGCIDTGGLAMGGFLKNLSQQNNNFDGRNKLEDTDDDRDAGIDNFNYIKVPAQPVNWLEGIDIVLTTAEATFLKNACINRANNKLEQSLLSALFQNPVLMTCLNDATNFAKFARTATSLPSISSVLKKHLILAHDFAEVIHGAHILYNHILQQNFFADDYDDQFLEQWHEWQQGLAQNMINFEGFNIMELTDWMSETRMFASKWWDYVRKNARFDKHSIIPLVQLIKARELVSKGKKARLQNNLQTNADMQVGKWIGLKPLEYRFANAKRIVQDILNPLEHA